MTPRLNSYFHFIFILVAFISPRQIWVAAGTATTSTSMFGKNQLSSSHQCRIHHSHMFHLEPRAIISSVLSDVRRQTLNKNIQEAYLLSIDVSSNRLDDRAAVFLMEELVSLLKSKVVDSHDSKSESKPPLPLIRLALVMNKLTPSGASRMFREMKNESTIPSPPEDRNAVGGETANKMESESDLLSEINESSETSSNAMGVVNSNNQTRDEDTTNKTKLEGRTPADISHDATAFLIEELDLSFNDIGGHGIHSPNVELLDAVRRLFEGDGTALVPRILSLENCGIGPAFCRQIGRGILNAFEKNHAGANDLRYRPSVLRMGGNNAIGDAGTVALAAALRLAKGNDVDNTNVLNELDLSSCNVGDAGAEALSLALSSNPGCLIRLDLSNNKITDAGSKALGRALVDASLSSGAVFEKIVLDNNDIGDDGAAALSEAMAVGAVKSVSMRSCSIKAEGTAALGRALMSLANRNHEFTHFNIDLSGNHFGTQKIKKKKGKASLIRDKASTNIKFIGKTLTSAAKRFGSETMGITADSDDDEEVMGGLIEEGEEIFGDKLQSCGGLAIAREILRREENPSSQKKEKEIRTLKIYIGMRQCCLDDGAIDAISASMVGAKNCDISVDVSMNSVDENIAESLKSVNKDSKLLLSMAKRHMDFLDRIDDARQRQLEAAEVVDSTFFYGDDDYNLDSVDSDSDPYDDCD